MEVVQLFEDLGDEDEELIQNLLENTRKARIFRSRPDNFVIWNEEEFFARFRLRKGTVEKLLTEIREKIEHKTKRNMAMTAMNQLLMTLRFYATGSMLITAGDFCGVHKATASRIIKKVSTAIAELGRTYIRTPATAMEINREQDNFDKIAHFPRVVGCIDCTHIKILSPGGAEPETFRNRKGYFSLNTQVLCASNMKITDLVTRWPGSTHDQTILNNSTLKSKLSRNYFRNGIILGDSGYRQERYIMTPIRNPVTQEEHLYNESQIRTRNVIERMFGVWKRRFPILAYGIRLSLDKIMTVVVACAVLHNLAIDEKDGEPPQDPRVPAIDLEIENDVAEDDIGPGYGREPFVEHFRQLLRNQINN